MSSANQHDPNRLTPLLTKEATSTNPGRVVNITSMAGVDPKAEETSLGPADTGLWSCTYKENSTFFIIPGD